MLIPTLEGWKAETIGDDIAWMKFGDDGRLYAINPEAGFFGVAPGTGPSTNPNALKMVEHDTVFTNVAKTDDGDVWWEGLTDDPPAHLVDWTGKDWTPGSDKPAAHPNSRFTTAAEQAPSIAAEWEDPKGVPIDAMLFGGRRSTTVPLIVESLDWRHGVLLGACMGSETTAAIVGKVGKLRRDPFAMLAFCGYHMADYFEHWLEIGRREGAKLPKLYNVNWFRKDLASGEYLWPGFGENSRVLKWVFERCDGGAEAVETPIGLLPTDDALDLTGVDVSAERMHEVLKVDLDEWRAEIPLIREFFDQFGDKLPEELRIALDGLEGRIERG